MEATYSHSAAFRRRRFLNWFPLGLAYAFLYMGRYNLTVSKLALGTLMSKEDFGIIFGAGTVTYAFSFLLNGPLTDKIGGKKGMLIGVGGSALMNVIMGLYIAGFTVENASAHHLRTVFAILYSLNMYFQSYGALSIVKVNSRWFHVRERGGFSGIFGAMISSGIFFAFTVNAWVLGIVFSPGDSNISATKLVFFLPAFLLASIFVFELFVLKDKPSQAGLEDFNVGDATSNDTREDIPVTEIMKRVLTDSTILTIAFLEFCTGVLRNGVMHWFPIYAKEVLHLPKAHWLRNGSWADWYLVVAAFVVAAVFFIIAVYSSGRKKPWFYIMGSLTFLTPFFMAGWGGILMVAGIIGGNIAGWVSDLFFQSRRAPAAAGLYALMLIVVIILNFILTLPVPLGIAVFLISLSVIGTHGLMSGTATMDFGGSKGAATAVGMIDGFVYLGTGLQAFALGYLTSKSWSYWPLFLLPFAVIGFALAVSMWNKKPGQSRTQKG